MAHPPHALRESREPLAEESTKSIRLSNLFRSPKFVQKINTWITKLLPACNETFHFALIKQMEINQCLRLPHRDARWNWYVICVICLWWVMWSCMLIVTNITWSQTCVPAFSFIHMPYSTRVRHEYQQCMSTTKQRDMHWLTEEFGVESEQFKLKLKVTIAVSDFHSNNLALAVAPDFKKVWKINDNIILGSRVV